MLLRTNYKNGCFQANLTACHCFFASGWSLANLPDSLRANILDALGCWSPVNISEHSSEILFNEHSSNGKAVFVRHYSQQSAQIYSQR